MGADEADRDVVSSAERDLVVPCVSGAHKVRLRGGRRFFSRARCPACGAPVDPHYHLRVARFLANLRRPASADLLDRLTWALSLGGLAVALLTVVVFRVGADVWWPATVLLFGPRWVLLLPLAPVTLLAAWRDRALLLPLAVATVVLTGPVLGFTLGLRSLLTRERDGDLLVVSFNAAGGSSLNLGVSELLDRWDAELVMIQECGDSMRLRLRDVEGWHVESVATLCTASRHPILSESVMDRAVLASVGGSGLVATYAIDRDGSVFHATNVHLETPRDGLELIRRGRVGEGAEILRQKSILREIELQRAERGAREVGSPGMVLGDFNTPPESRHMGAIWGDWSNAFSVAGFGVGGTRLNGWIRVRIDHVMLDDAWVVVDAWAGDHVGSDHLPMLARVRLR